MTSILNVENDLSIYHFFAILQSIKQNSEFIMTNETIFDFKLFDIPKIEPEFYIEVRLQFDSNKEIETVNFKNINVFNMISDSVTVQRWKHISELDGSKEILNDGSNIESMINYFTEIEREAKSKKK